MVPFVVYIKRENGTPGGREHVKKIAVSRGVPEVIPMDNHMMDVGFMKFWLVKNSSLFLRIYEC